jgi:hypothetical protein
MTRLTACLSLLAVLLAGAPGCTPSLNWRDVQLGGLTTLLPCKPDTAARDIVLKDRSYRMDMAGCEAGGAVFAISRVQAGSAAEAPILLETLRQASLALVQAKPAPATPAGALAPTGLDLQVDGARPDGSALQVHFRWLVQGTYVYQIAAYADQLLIEQTEPLLREARLR